MPLTEQITICTPHVRTHIYATSQHKYHGCRLLIPNSARTHNKFAFSPNSPLLANINARLVKAVILTLEKISLVKDGLNNGIEVPAYAIDKDLN